MAVDLTRAVGQTMARLADWEVATLVHRVQELAADDANGSRATAALRLVEALNEPFEGLLVYVWRRHLAAAAARVEAFGADDADLHTTLVTVGFADIVQFTALTNRLDHDRIGDLVEIFESRCADVVAGQRGRVIKSLGDAVLFVNEDPIRAYDTAEGIIAVIGRDQRMPDVRVGLSTGSVVTRLGDVFGPPVNLAARLTARRPAQPDHRRRRHRGAPSGGPVRGAAAPGATGARLRGGRASGRSTSLRHGPEGLVGVVRRGNFTRGARRVARFPGGRPSRVPIFDTCSRSRTSSLTRLPAGCGEMNARSSSRARNSTCCIS